MEIRTRVWGLVCLMNNVGNVSLAFDSVVMINFGVLQLYVPDNVHGDTCSLRMIGTSGCEDAERKGRRVAGMVGAKL